MKTKTNAKRLFMAVSTLVLALAFASCNKGTIDEEVVNKNTPVKFLAGINNEVISDNSQTRARNWWWEFGDKIGVFMMDNSTSSISEKTANRQYNIADVKAGTVAAQSGQEIYYPMSGQAVYFVAYYPYISTLTDVNYEINVSKQNPQSDIDLLWSKSDNNGDGYTKNYTDNVPLQFAHKLSKIVINVVKPSSLSPNNTGLTDSDLTGMTITFKGLNTTADFDLNYGTIDMNSSGNVGDISPVTITDGVKYEAIILPATFSTKGEFTIEFALNNDYNDVFVWQNPIGEKFETGKKYTYAMTLTRSGVTFTTSISPWDESDSERQGTAE